MSSPHASLPIERLERRLEAEPGGHGSLAGYHALFAERSDTPADLFRIAGNVSNQEARAAAFLCGVRRAIEQKAPLPSKLPELFLGWARVESSWELEACVGLSELHAALAALDGTARHVVVSALLGRDHGYALGWLGLPLVANAPELQSRALERLATWRFPSSEIARAIALFDPPQRAGVCAWLGAHPDAPAAYLVRMGLLMSFANGSGGLEEEVKAALDVHTVWPAESQELFARHAAPRARVVIARQPEAFVDAWLAAQLDAARPTSFRVLCVASALSDAHVARVLAFCVENARALKKPAPDWITELARALGARANAQRPALPKGKVRAAFEAGCAASESESEVSSVAAVAAKAKAAPAPASSAPSAAAAKLIALADESPPGPRTPIVLLETTRGAPRISRVGGPGVDLGERHPKTSDGLPMTHVLTLALDDAPVARHAFPNAAAFALYVSAPRDLDPSEPDADITVIDVMASDLARGEAAPTGLELPTKAVRATPLDVPSDAFTSAKSPLGRALARWPARAGGEPLWLQEPSSKRGFVMQFDARFAPLSMGDAGVMYVFDGGAFWQSR